MRIIFNLMGTVFGSLDESLRPGIADTIKVLRESGNKVDFWTSGRVDSYRAFLKNYGLSGDVYSKQEPLPFVPDICVDDDPQEWMPGIPFKVGNHICAEEPGERILVAEILGYRGGTKFYWD